MISFAPSLNQRLLDPVDFQNLDCEQGLNDNLPTNASKNEKLRGSLRVHGQQSNSFSLLNLARELFCEGHMFSQY